MVAIGHITLDPVLELEESRHTMPEDKEAPAEKTKPKERKPPRAKRKRPSPSALGNVTPPQLAEARKKAAAEKAEAEESSG